MPSTVSIIFHGSLVSIARLVFHVLGNLKFSSNAEIALGTTEPATGTVAGL